MPTTPAKPADPQIDHLRADPRVRIGYPADPKGN